MEGLKQVYLRKCQEFTCAPIHAFVEDLDAAHGACLTELKLNGNSKRLFNNRVQPMQVFALCETLAEDANVIAVDLSYNVLNDLAAQAIAGLIKANPAIRFINLAGNSIGPVGAKHLASALGRPECSVQVLSLAGNPLEEEGSQAMAEMMRSNTSLQAADLSNINAGIKGMLSICAALGSEGIEDTVNTTLQALDIGAPIIHMQQDAVVLALARMLKNNTTLLELGISKLKLVDSQFKTLVTYGLLHNCTLQSLDLRANKLSGFSGPQFERVLAECKQITSLNLEANSLGDAGARCVAGCIPYSPWLSRLDLRSNGIGEQGLRSLADALGSAPHLRLLLLWGNAFGPASCKALKEALDNVPQGVAPQGALITDIQPYEVDGAAQVSLIQVDDLLEAEADGDDASN